MTTPVSDVLNRLLFENKIRATELARKINVSQPTIHRISTGKSRNPDRSTLELIAKYFSIEVEQLCGKEPLSQSDLKISFPDAVKKAVEIPIIPWKDITTFQKSLVNSLDLILASPGSGKNCFAFKMPDSSMEPLFIMGTFLIIDPDKQAYDRSYVLVKLEKNNSIVFRQILFDVERRFLKPTNPELGNLHMRCMAHDDRVLGVLVETRQRFEEPI